MLSSNAFNGIEFSVSQMGTITESGGEVYTVFKLTRKNRTNSYLRSFYIRIPRQTTRGSAKCSCDDFTRTRVNCIHINYVEEYIRKNGYSDIQSTPVGLKKAFENTKSGYTLGSVNGPIETEETRKEKLNKLEVRELLTDLANRMDCLGWISSTSSECNVCKIKAQCVSYRRDNLVPMIGDLLDLLDVEEKTVKEELVST